MFNASVLIPVEPEKHLPVFGLENQLTFLAIDDAVMILVKTRTGLKEQARSSHRCLATPFRSARKALAAWLCLESHRQNQAMQKKKHDESGRRSFVSHGYPRLEHLMNAMTDGIGSVTGTYEQTFQKKSAMRPGSKAAASAASPEPVTSLNAF